jgi:deoxyadenosine/deoxycytidine kinase
LRGEKSRFLSVFRSFKVYIDLFYTTVSPFSSLFSFFFLKKKKKKLLMSLDL